MMSGTTQSGRHPGALACAMECRALGWEVARCLSSGTPFGRLRALELARENRAAAVRLESLLGGTQKEAA